MTKKAQTKTDARDISIISSLNYNIGKTHKTHKFYISCKYLFILILTQLSDILPLLIAIAICK